MKCPKCEEGTLIKIKFKKSGKHANVCDFCESLWFEDDVIASTTGHTLQTYTKEDEHGFEELDSQDHDHKPAPVIRKL